MVATFDSDEFRRDRLYNRETDRMLRTHLAPLKALYALYGPSEGGKPTFNLGSLRRLLSDLAFLAWDIHCLSLPMVRLAFFNSRMVVGDVIKQRHKFMTLSFIEFVEALARVADSMNVPTDEDLAKLGVASVVDLDLVVLEQKVDVSFLRETHGSADVMAESERPLVEKLDRFLVHLFGRLGLRDGGIKTPARRSRSSRGTSRASSSRPCPRSATRSSRCSPRRTSERGPSRLRGRGGISRGRWRPIILGSHNIRSFLRAERATRAARRRRRRAAAIRLSARGRRPTRARRACSRARRGTRRSRVVRGPTFAAARRGGPSRPPPAARALELWPRRPQRRFARQLRRSTKAASA